MIFILGGMGAVGAGIVGAPMTMIFLVLEATADFSATMGVTVAVVSSALVVRHFFGYSFATWRFHLRGVALQTPHDIGWVRDLQVSKLMRRDFVLVPRHDAACRVAAAVPGDGEPAGFLSSARAGLMKAISISSRPTPPSSATDAGGPTVTVIAHGKAHTLTPSQPVRDALDIFIDSAEEVLAVLDNPRDRHVAGYLTEAFALRRYYRELEARHREELGDEGLFTSTHGPATHPG